MPRIAVINVYVEEITHNPLPMNETVTVTGA